MWTQVMQVGVQKYLLIFCDCGAAFGETNSFYAGKHWFVQKLTQTRILHFVGKIFLLLNLILD